MKSIYLLAFLLCTSLGFAQTPASDAYASTIESEDLKQLLYVYASDFFQGRETGTLGQKRAVTFLKEFYESRGIQAGAGSEDYFQKMTLTIKGEEIDTENVIAIIEGSEKPEEYLVISSHLDHIGTHEGEINNGASSYATQHIKFFFRLFICRNTDQLISLHNSSKSQAHTSIPRSPFDNCPARL